MVHGLARGAPPRPRCAAQERCERAAGPLPHGRPAAELEGVAPRGVPRALVVLERGLRARRRRVRGGGKLLLLGGGAAAAPRPSRARADGLRGTAARGPRACPGVSDGSAA